jgi:CubicO group peptidase (beta-lactamase class C family)
MAGRLFHVSHEAGITRFEPRPNYRVTGEMVWAVDEAHLVNFLTPRDCPRITYGAGLTTTPEDIARFLGAGLRRVVAFEACWLDRVRAATLNVYEMPPETFESELPDAGYWISRTSVRPIGCTVVTDALGAMVEGGAEVRMLQDFWPLCDAVAASTLEFSIIHKDAARPRKS